MTTSSLPAWQPSGSNMTLRTPSQREKHRGDTSQSPKLTPQQLAERIYGARATKPRLNGSLSGLSTPDRKSARSPRPQTSLATMASPLPPSSNPPSPREVETWQRQRKTLRIPRRTVLKSAPSSSPSAAASVQWSARNLVFVVCVSFLLAWASSIWTTKAGWKKQDVFPKLSGLPEAVISVNVTALHRSRNIESYQDVVVESDVRRVLQDVFIPYNGIVHDQRADGDMFIASEQSDVNEKFQLAWHDMAKVEHIGVLNGGWRRDASFPVPKNHWQQSKEGGDSIVESFLGVDSSPTVDVQIDVSSLSITLSARLPSRRPSGIRGIVTFLSSSVDDRERPWSSDETHVSRESCWTQYENNGIIDDVWLAQEWTDAPVIEEASVEYAEGSVVKRVVPLDYIPWDDLEDVQEDVKRGQSTFIPDEKLKLRCDGNFYGFFVGLLSEENCVGPLAGSSSLFRLSDIQIWENKTFEQEKSFHFVAPLPSLCQLQERKKLGIGFLQESEEPEESRIDRIRRQNDMYWILFFGVLGLVSASVYFKYKTAILRALAIAGIFVLNVTSSLWHAVSSIAADEGVAPAAAAGTGETARAAVEKNVESSSRLREGRSASDGDFNDNELPARRARSKTAFTLARELATKSNVSFLPSSSPNEQKRTGPAASKINEAVPKESHSISVGTDMDDFLQIDNIGAEGSATGQTTAAAVSVEIMEEGVMTTQKPMTHEVGIQALEMSDVAIDTSDLPTPVMGPTINTPSSLQPRERAPASSELYSEVIGKEERQSQSNVPEPKAIPPIPEMRDESSVRRLDDNPLKDERTSGDSDMDSSFQLHKMQRRMSFRALPRRKSKIYETFAMFEKLGDKKSQQRSSSLIDVDSKKRSDMLQQEDRMRDIHETWSVHTDSKHNRQYFYNKKLRQSFWLPPEDLMSSLQGAGINVEEFMTNFRKEAEVASREAARRDNRRNEVRPTASSAGTDTMEEEETEGSERGVRILTEGVESRHEPKTVTDDRHWGEAPFSNEHGKSHDDASKEVVQEDMAIAESSSKGKIGKEQAGKRWKKLSNIFRLRKKKSKDSSS